MTAHTDFELVNILLNQLVRNIESTLGNNFIGCYLFGSLAVGDFDPSTSDVDVLIATRQNLGPLEVEQLSSFHKALFLSKTPFSSELECFYASQTDLQNCAPGKSPCFKVDRGNGSLQLETLDADWVINSYSLLNYGKTIKGPPISSLIAPVSVEKLKAAVRDLLEMWWFPMTKDRKKLEHAGYRFYAILTMARMLATFELNKIVSKKVAAAYALAELDGRWIRLIEKALNRDDSASVEETQALIGFTRQRLATEEPEV